MKYINFKRYKFSTIFKNVNLKRYQFLKIFDFIDFSTFNFKKVYKYLDIKRFGFIKFAKYLNSRTYINQISRAYINQIKKINLISSKFLRVHLPVSIVFFCFLYLLIPTFYKYDKSNIENLICKNQNVVCLIKGEINYNLYPTPRIIIKDLAINDFTEVKKTLINAQSAVLKLSFKNLLTKDKHQYKKVELKNFEINLNTKNFKKYKNFFSKKINLIPIKLLKGKIIFFDGNNYVASINDVNLNLVVEGDLKEIELKGKFLNDNIYITLKNKKDEGKSITDLILKMTDLNLLTKTNFINSEQDKDAISGNILIKKNKHRFTGIFDYMNNEITINKSNLKNIFLDGNLEGKIKLIPYFNFNLDLSLNSIDFTKLYNSFLALDEMNQKNLFKINRKINGKLNLSSDKIYSSYNLVKSLESRIKFNNGNILIEQFLISLGKLGAADILGSINNDKKFTNFKYESNVFIDNKKKFLSKFGIYNKKNIPPNLFISGNFDLKNIKNSFYEILGNEKLSDEDVNFVEKEFNDLMLTDGYEDLFRFPIFKEFIKSITSETN